ncbi:MAG TPA: 50S ribosomal protein L29 [Saprospiraceae bacterium]|jgi:large subunit ribosomal protein L29|nr:50S ribosomal protein L29 [Saprospiraceae bacterium]MBK6665088.1 50S ribosomal protein L29 [Saprospiraceae bacterium]MBK7699052.1 50S ribosomal protein L29 [Saprospiraceae bacterium]MBK8826744.1 50S ribosomal protein L29 [Saprospiraceae bacterium]MBK8886674.1 50S ribosomal protein L29 [Saprospiraceae bacterium]
MATKKFLELQNMAADAINAELKQASADLVRMKFDHGSKGLQNPIELKSLKRDIARLKTELRAREISAMTPEQLAGRSNIRLRRK